MPKIVLTSDEDAVDASIIEFHSDWVLADERRSEFWRCIPQDSVEEIYATDNEKDDFTFSN